MYRIISTSDPAGVLSGNADRTHTRKIDQENDRRQESLDSYIPYVDYVPGRDI